MAQAAAVTPALGPRNSGKATNRRNIWIWTRKSNHGEPECVWLLTDHNVVQMLTNQWKFDNLKVSNQLVTFHTMILSSFVSPLCECRAALCLHGCHGHTDERSHLKRERVKFSKWEKIELVKKTTTWWIVDIFSIIESLPCCLGDQRTERGLHC